jgi:TPP-dependent pyruvate/acetoin dehydrogenase alpha subunit
LVKHRILENKWATEEELEAMDNKSREFVEECIEFMENLHIRMLKNLRICICSGRLSILR